MQALSHAVLDVLSVWLVDPAIIQYLLLPDSQIMSLKHSHEASCPNNSRPRGIFHPSAVFVSTVQTLLLFLLVRPDDEMTKSTQQFGDSGTSTVASRALSILQSLYAPVFHALQTQSSYHPSSAEQMSEYNQSTSSDVLYGQTCRTTSSTDVEMIDLTSQIDELLRQNWQIWLFPILHSFSIIAAFCPDLSVRAEVLSVRQFIIFSNLHLL